jgi:dynein intermediate chain 4, axonemal
MFHRKKNVEKKEEDEDKKEEELKDGEVRINHLFTFKHEEFKRPVTCIDINSRNPDLIAAGYGDTDIGVRKDDEIKPGYLCFWTLKNPSYPEKVFKTDHSITCCQWSKRDPNLIAVGDSHGNIAIYNVRGTDMKPIAESKDLDGKHTDVIWELQWVEKKDKGEFLISISGDGRIIEWSMKKGLEFTELKVLKRETNPN